MPFFKYIIIPLLLFFATMHHLDAQQMFYAKVKKDKKVYTGQLIKFVPEKSLTILVNDKEKTFTLDEITYKLHSNMLPPNYSFPTKPLYKNVRIGIMPYEDQRGFSLALQAHKHFSNLFGIGASAEYVNYNPRNGYNFFNPAISFQSFLLKRNITPFIRANFGYAIPLKSKKRNITSASGSPSILAEIGYRYYIKSGVVMLSLAYRNQSGIFNYDFQEFSRTDELNIRRLEYTLTFMWR